MDYNYFYASDNYSKYCKKLDNRYPFDCIGFSSNYPCGCFHHLFSNPSLPPLFLSYLALHQNH